MRQITECYEATHNSPENYTLAICLATGYVTSLVALGCNCPKICTEKTQAEVNRTDKLQETG